MNAERYIYLGIERFVAGKSGILYLLMKCEKSE